MHVEQQRDAAVRAIADGGDVAEFLDAARREVVEHIEHVTADAGWTGDARPLMPGKMLRTRWAARLVASGICPGERSVVVPACAATELLHAATLCHDDLIDRGTVRRGRRALWVATSPSAAVLMGDMLFCDSLQLAATTAGGRYMQSFLAKAQEVLAAEVRQELLLRGRYPGREACVGVSRGKTGPLFAFVAQVCGGDDLRLGAALEEAGYCIGTAYQLLDDLLDVFGNEDSAGKTLGTDGRRGKITLPQTPGAGPEMTISSIMGQCVSAVQCLRGYPELSESVRQFVALDLQEVADNQPDLRVRLAV